jgi:lipopolysaccharide transport system ATP-binding protein
MSFDPDVVISARSLSKAYQLYNGQQEWMKQVLFGSFHTYYRSFWVLNDINLEIRRGENVAILGRNGCGKSTLLQIICGITRPTKGELWVNGRVAPVLALGATFDLESTGRENVLIGGAVMGLKRADVVQKIDSIADFAGIGDFLDQPVKLYSTGMRTRLAFAICAHVDADILIVDEALSVGDEAFQQKCFDWIDNFRTTGTLLFVSHSMEEVRRLCSKAIWIDAGKVRKNGIPDEVIASYLEVAESEPDDMRRFSAA